MASKFRNLIAAKCRSALLHHNNNKKIPSLSEIETRMRLDSNPSSTPHPYRLTLPPEVLFGQASHEIEAGKISDFVESFETDNYVASVIQLKNDDTR